MLAALGGFGTAEGSSGKSCVGVRGCYLDSVGPLNKNNVWITF